MFIELGLVGCKIMVYAYKKGRNLHQTALGCVLEMSGKIEA